MADYRNNNDRAGKSGVPGWVNVLLFVLIIAVLAFAVFRLLAWNKGRKLQAEQVDESEYEVEVLDQIFLLPSDKLEGHEKDDTETILVLGNDAVTYDASGTGVCAQIADKTDATVINAGFPGTTVALKSPEGEGDNYDALSFYSTAKAIAEGNAQPLLDAAWTIGDEVSEQHAQALADLDMNTVDTLVIYYDALDYIKLRPGMNPGDSYDPMTYMGSLNSGIKAIQEKYPFIRIVCMSFTFCYAYDTDGSLKNGDMVDFGNGKLTTYLQHMIDTCGDKGVSFVDNYYGTIDEGNSSEYLLDNIHVNQACNEHIATHFAQAIYNK